MERIKETLAYVTADTVKSCTLYENGFIRAVVLTLPNFTTAASVSTIVYKDVDGDTISTDSTGYAENTTHLISSLAIPVSAGSTVSVTLNAASGGAHNATIKFFIEKV